MNAITKALAITTAAAALTFCGTAMSQESKRKPIEIVPMTMPDGSTSYCRTKDRNLIVHLKNPNDKPAPAMYVSVVFHQAGDSDKIIRKVPQIEANSTSEHSFAIPAHCYDPDCVFTIEAQDLHALWPQARGICKG